MKLLYTEQNILIVVLILLAYPVFAARDKFANDFSKVEIGYTATFLSGDQGATLNMFSARNDSTFVTGSRFIGAQSGLSARVNFDVGSRFIVPVGLDLTFMRGLQRLENPGLSGHGSVSSNVTSIVAGIQYRAFDLPLSEAFLYGGIEARGSFVGAARFTYDVIDTRTGQPIPIYSQDATLKPSVFRFGGALRVGVQGILSEPLRININWAYGVNNLFGRDLRTVGPDRRGQLLTPTRIGETSEAFSKFHQFSIWLQYHF